MSKTVVRLDARGLEPPEPMVLALEHLEALKKDEIFEMTLNREPFPLYEKATEMGFVFNTDFLNDGRVVIRFQHQSS